MLGTSKSPNLENDPQFIRCWTIILPTFFFFLGGGVDRPNTQTLQITSLGRSLISQAQSYLEDHGT